MSNCVYCGRPAGFLLRKHKECHKRHHEAAKRIPDFFIKALGSSIEPARFRAMTEEIARSNFVTDIELRQLEIVGLQKMLDYAFSDKVFSEEEEQRITELCNTFGIAANDLGDLGLRLAKCQILRLLEEGKFPENVHIKSMPINLSRNEIPIWLYNDVAYFKFRNRTQYIGGSHGVSIRVMKGIYYRVGAFKGEPVQTQYLSEEGRGVLIITNSNLYFWSVQKVIKMPMKKIISVQPYSDGIHIFRDGTNPLPQIFTMDDPLFACDAIARLSRSQ